MRSILSNWDLIRFVRAGLGLSFIGQGIASNSIPVILIGSALVMMALFNLGCSSSKGCALPNNKTTGPSSTP